MSDASVSPPVPAASEPEPAPLPEVRAATERFCAGSGIGGGVAVATHVVAALGRGQSLGAALSSAGVPSGVAAAFSTASVKRPEIALDEVGLALGRRGALAAQVRSAALYPALVALSTLVVAWLVSADAVPALAAARVMVAGEGAAPGVVATLPAVVVSAVLLVLFAAALAMDLPFLSFGEARSARERALFLSGLHGFVSAGAVLPAAVRAAAGLSSDADLSARARAFADGLERGETSAHGLLDGLSAALLSEAVKAGTEPAALSALVVAARRRAGEAAATAVGRVRTSTLLVAGLSVLLLGVTWIGAYAATFGGGP